MLVHPHAISTFIGVLIVMFVDVLIEGHAYIL